MLSQIKICKVLEDTLTKIEKMTIDKKPQM